MQLKTTVKILLFDSLAKVKNVTSVDEDTEKMEPHRVLVGARNDADALENDQAIPQKVETGPRNSTSTYIPKRHVHTQTRTRTFVAALSINKSGNYPDAY